MWSGRSNGAGKAIQAVEQGQRGERSVRGLTYVRATVYVGATQAGSHANDRSRRRVARRRPCGCRLAAQTGRWPRWRPCDGRIEIAGGPGHASSDADLRLAGPEAAEPVDRSNLESTPTDFRRAAAASSEPRTLPCFALPCGWRSLGRPTCRVVLIDDPGDAANGGTPPCSILSVRVKPSCRTTRPRHEAGRLGSGAPTPDRSSHQP